MPSVLHFACTSNTIVDHGCNVSGLQVDTVIILGLFRGVNILPSCVVRECTCSAAKESPWSSCTSNPPESCKHSEAHVD